MGGDPICGRSFWLRADTSRDIALKGGGHVSKTAKRAPQIKRLSFQELWFPERDWLGVSGQLVELLKKTIGIFFFPYVYIVEEYLCYGSASEFFLDYLWNMSIQYLQILDNSPNSQSSTTTEPLSEISSQGLLLSAWCSP